MVFDDYKSILAMHGDSATMEFCEPYGAAPIGFRATFVVLSEMGTDDYYFVARSAVITDGQIESLVPKKTPYDEIKNYLTNL